MREIYSIQILDENKNITNVLPSKFPIKTENDYEHEKSENFENIEKRIVEEIKRRKKQWNANDI